jgi:hypothetical protein
LEDGLSLNCDGSGKALLPSRWMIAVCVVFLAGIGTIGLGYHTVLVRDAADVPAMSSRVSQPSSAPVPVFGGMPLIFEPNVGQTDPQVKFMARGKGYGIFLTGTEAVLKLQGANKLGSISDVVRMKLVGADSRALARGAELLPGKSNYFIGNDPSRWRRGVSQFAQVRYQNIYRGIDLVYYGKQGRLEYDFQVAPGADLDAVGLEFTNSQGMKLEDGALVIPTAAGLVQFAAPQLYQVVDGQRKPVAGRFVQRGENRIGFEAGNYDRSRALVVDPVLSYSTFFGGSGGEGCSAVTGVVTSGCPAIATDTGANIYAAGTTTSTDFPLGSTPLQGTLNGPADVFVAKFSPTGSTVVFSTYLGGSGTDTSAGIGVDSGFNVFVAGNTDSSDFPTTPNAFQTTRVSANSHGFVTELNSSGIVLLYSTYLSGSGTDNITGIAIDQKNQAYVTGTTTSADFPTTAGAFQITSLATNQFFVTKINTGTTGLQSLAYSTYFGGGTPSNGVTVGGGIGVDVNSNVYFTGGTNFQHTGSNTTTDFPILNAYQSTLNGPTDAFVAKLNTTAASGAQLIYSTYLGGSGDETGYGVSADAGGSAYVTGSTTSGDFTSISFPGAFQKSYGGATDAFLAKLGPTSGTSAVSLTYFTYLGGTGTDVGLAVVADSLQGARITGYTTSSDLPVQTPLQGSYGGNTDAFIARFDTTATTPTASGHYSSYLGGSGTDAGTSIAADTTGATYIAGETSSSNFPTQLPIQPSLAGPSDAFVAKLGPNINLQVTGLATPTPVGVGNQVGFEYIIVNAGDATSGISLTSVLPTSGSTFVSALAAPGSCGGATGTPPTVTCSVGTLNAGATATVTINVTPTVAGSLGNSGTVSVLGSTFTGSASATATVNDFSISAAPTSVTVPAGAPATYAVTITPSPSFPNSVALSCSSGLPAAATCAFSTTPIANATNGPVSSTLTVNTTVRPTAMLRPGARFFYAALLPVSGMAFLGLGIAGPSRRKRWLGGLLALVLVGVVIFEAGCGSTTQTAPTTGGTPAGTYAVTITGTSGAVSRTTTATLIVQ